MMIEELITWMEFKFLFDIKEKKGDRVNSIFINSLKGFENTVHEVYSPKYNTFTRYLGNERANEPSKKSYID